MAVGSNNSRIMVKFTNEELDRLRKIAKSQNRSISNLISTIVKSYLTGITEDKSDRC